MDEEAQPDPGGPADVAARLLLPARLIGPARLSLSATRAIPYEKSL